MLLSKEFLNEQHILLSKSVNKIHTEFKIPYKQIEKALIKFNIQRSKKLRAKHGFLKKTEVKNKLSILGFKLIGNYINLNTKTEIQCYCGNIVKIEPKRFIRKLQKSCGCLHNRFGENSPSWKGYKEISYTRWMDLVNNAKKRKLNIEITIEDIWNQYIKQDKKCALTDLDLYWNKNRKSESNASIDRIDSSKGYTKDNIQIVHKIINTMKMDAQQKDFINMCNLVTKKANIKYTS